MAQIKNRFLGSLVLVSLLAAGFVAYWFNSKEEATKRQKAVYENLEILEVDGAFDFVKPTVEGESFRFHTLKGQVVLLNFWASWCAPCVIEYPSMLRLVDSFGGKLKMVAVSQDESRDDVERFLKRFGKGSDDVIHIWDPNREVAKKFGTEKLPETYIFNKELKLVRKVPNSEDWGRHEVREYLKQLLR